MPVHQQYRYETVSCKGPGYLDETVRAKWLLSSGVPDPAKERRRTGLWKNQMCDDGVVQLAVAKADFAFSPPLSFAEAEWFSRLAFVDNWALP